MKRQLVILKLDGDLRGKGFRTTLSIGQEGDRYIAMPTEAIGNLPADPELAELLQEHWEEKYRNVGSPSRIKPKRIIYQGPISKRIAACKASAEQLEQHFMRWLEDEQFRDSVNRLREELSRDDISRIIIRTGDRQIQKLPWHCWDFIRRYPKTEVAFSDLQTGRSPIQKCGKSQPGKVKVLAILGHSEGINVEADRKLLESLPGIETEFLPEPSREKLDAKLYEQAWDIIFFAGHSESETDTGKLYINSAEEIEIKDIWHALRKAVERGLQLAIFNSCDGLGLVQRLDDVQIPHMIVMRELVPDLVAHKFLKHFLQEFPKSESFYVAVREARERLQGLEGEIPCASWLPIICENPALIPLTWEDLTGGREEAPEPAPTSLPVQSQPMQPQPMPRRLGWKTMLFTSVAVTGLVVGVRSLGWLEAWELRAYDQFMRMRPMEEPDERILLLEVTERDLVKYGDPIPDNILAQAIQKLNEYQPSAIGLNIYRDLPQPPGEDLMADTLKNTSNLFSICTFPYDEEEEVAPPPDSPLGQVGFDNLLLDLPGYKTRRQLLSRTPNTVEEFSKCTTNYGFNFLIAFRYLAQRKIPVRVENQAWKMGDFLFERLNARSGGYQTIDARGFQILTNFRHANPLAQSITLSNFLNDEFRSDWIKDRVVLIGVTARSRRDEGLTLYGVMPKLHIQAHQISHILSVVLDDRPLIWWLPSWADWLSIGFCTFWIGGSFYLLQNRLRQLIILLGVSAITMYGIYFLIFLQGGWLPLIPSGVAIILMSVTTSIYLVREGRSPDYDY